MGSTSATKIYEGFSNNEKLADVNDLNGKMSRKCKYLPYYGDKKLYITNYHVKRPDITRKTDTELRIALGTIISTNKHIRT